jgi:STAS-like domain of unknown function (DUF4325)
MKPVLYLKDITGDTYTNAGGYQLFVVLNEYLCDKKTVTLSFKGSQPANSSFFNSSFGELIDKYGLDNFNRYVKITDLSQTMNVSLKRYLDTFNKTS